MSTFKFPVDLEEKDQVGSSENAKISYSDGSVYTGELDSNGKRHGLGTLRREPDISKEKLFYKYEGSFHENMFGKQPEGAAGELLVYFENFGEQVILLHYKGNF